MAYVGALDQGTTSTRFVIFDESRSPVASHQVEHKQITPKPGWLEHDPEEIVRNARLCLSAALDKFHAKVGRAAKLSAIGITNQRETTVAWDHTTQKPLYNAVVWSDARTQSTVEVLSAGNTEFARDVCGLPCSTYFSGVKMRWLLDNVPAVQAAQNAGTLRFGTIDSWLIYNLSGGAKHVTDCTNASRTMLMDIRTLQWSAALCERFGVAISSLPQIISCSEHICDISLGGRSVSIAGCIGDQQGALVGQLCFSKGMCKNTYGTGCFLLQNVGTDVPAPSKAGLLTTVGFKFGEGPCNYAVEGAIAGAGSTVQWLRDRLGVLRSAADSESVARSVPDSGGVVFVPAFGGLLAPYWRPDARGTIVGMTQQTTRAHIVRATLDAVAQQVAIMVNAMESENNVRVQLLSVDGGMVANRLLMQLQADALGIDVSIPSMLETTAAGAAICAALHTRAWGDVSQLRTTSMATVVRPQASATQRAEQRRRWDAAVRRSFGWTSVSKL